MGCVTLVLLICIDSTSVNAVCELASGVRKRVSILWTASSGPFVRKKKESVDNTSQPDRPHHAIAHTYKHTCLSFSACVTALKRSDAILRVHAGIHRRATFFSSRWSTYVFFSDAFLYACHGKRGGGIGVDFFLFFQSVRPRRVTTSVCQACRSLGVTTSVCQTCRSLSFSF